MKYYRSRRKSTINTRKIIFRIMFVVVAAILILTVTTLIGKHLKNKVEKAEENAVELTVTPGLQTERHIEETAIYDDYSPTVFGSAIRVSDYLSGSSGKSDDDEDEESDEEDSDDEDEESEDDDDED